MADPEGQPGESPPLKRTRRGPGRGPRKYSFTVRLTEEEEEYLVHYWGWVQAGITVLVQSSMARMPWHPLPDVSPPKPKKGREKKG